MVPVVPVCTYAHARGGWHVFAERVKKKTGTNWDRDQGRITLAGKSPAALRRSPAQTTPADSCGRFSPLLLESFHVRERPGLTWQGSETSPAVWRVRLPGGHLTDFVNPSWAKDAITSRALALLDLHQEAA